MNEKYAHPSSQAGRRRLARLEKIADDLEMAACAVDWKGRASAIRWAVRMLKVYRGITPDTGAVARISASASERGEAPADPQQDPTRNPGVTP